MIPSENELAAAYGLSVGKVKKALSDLVNEGVLYRRQGKGTFIARPDCKRSFICFRNSTGRRDYFHRADRLHAGEKPVEFRSSVGRGDRFRYHIEIR